MQAFAKLTQWFFDDCLCRHRPDQVMERHYQSLQRGLIDLRGAVAQLIGVEKAVKELANQEVDDRELTDRQRQAMGLLSSLSPEKVTAWCDLYSEIVQCARKCLSCVEGDCQRLYVEKQVLVALSRLDQRLLHNAMPRLIRQTDKTLELTRLLSCVAALMSRSPDIHILERAAKGVVEQLDKRDSDCLFDLVTADVIRFMPIIAQEDSSKAVLAREATISRIECIVHMLEKMLAKNQEQATVWNERAQMAMAQRADDLTKQCLVNNQFFIDAANFISTCIQSLQGLKVALSSECSP